MGHGVEFWQNMVHWRREWQTTSVVFLPWELHEQYEILGHVLSFLSLFIDIVQFEKCLLNLILSLYGLYLLCPDHLVFFSFFFFTSFFMLYIWIVNDSHLLFSVFNHLLKSIHSLFLVFQNKLLQHCFSPA